MYYDRRGQPCSKEYFIEKHKDESYRKVAVTELKSCAVITEWLGLDHNFGRLMCPDTPDMAGPPLIFETSVMMPSCVVKYRHSSLGEAMTEHDSVVDYLSSKLEDGEGGSSLEDFSL